MLAFGKRFILRHLFNWNCEFKTSLLSPFSDRKYMGRFNNLFLIVAMSVTSLLMWGFAVFQGHFSKATEFKYQMSALEQKVEKERQKQEYLVYQLEDMKQNLSKVVDATAVKPNANLQIAGIKNWEASLRKPSSVIDLSGVLFERAKKMFKAGDFDRVISLSDELMEKFPMTPYMAEVYFLKAESYYLKRDFKSALTVIEQMISLFPDSELTGFILLRMGQISEINNRTEEAIEIYKTAKTHFKSEAVQKQAQLMIQSIERE